jgi:hypothetical protein
MIDGCMSESKEELSSSIVGHRIVSWEKQYEFTLLTLDNGNAVSVKHRGDCCAFSEINKVTQMIDNLVDHVITSVSVEGDHERWFILSDAGPVLGMDIAWSEGSGCYIYAFDILISRQED